MTDHLHFVNLHYGVVVPGLRSLKLAMENLVGLSLRLHRYILLASIRLSDFTDFLFYLAFTHNIAPILMIFVHNYSEYALIPLASFYRL